MQIMKQSSDHFEHPSNLDLNAVLEGHPRLQKWSVFATAILGYLVLFLFPTLALVGIYNLVASVTTQAQDLQTTIIWGGLAILGLSVTNQLLTLNFRNHDGVTVSKELAPQLHAYIDAHKSGNLDTTIHEVQLNDRFELKLLKVPAAGLPVWSRNVLVIGFGMMQSLSKRQFDYALTAKIRQAARNKNPMIHWLAQLTHVWALYPATLKKRSGLGDRMLAKFFEWYAPFYKNLARPIVQQSDMLGDRYALAIYNDQDLLESIEAQAVADYYLRKHFWPNIKKMIKEQGISAKTHAFAMMPKSLELNLSSAMLDRTLMHIHNGANYGRLAPLAERMENIGHTRLRKLKPWVGTAGIHYFGQQYMLVADTMDKFWLARHYKPGKKRATARKETKAAAEHNHHHTATA
jgi:hypothetical protein